MVRRGEDPIDAKRAKTLDKALALTLEQCARRFYKAQEAGWSASHRQSWLRDLERDVFPVIGGVLVDRIGVKEVLVAIEPHWITKHETASRNRGRIEKVLDYARAMRLRTSEINPARWRGGIDAILPPAKKVKAKTHLEAMPFGEVPAFVAQLRDRADVASRALEFLILTAARSGEVLGVQWSEIDLGAGTWTIPASRMKARREHVVPLVPRAVEILNTLHRRGEYVFDLARDALIDLVKAAGNYTAHGFRASFSSWCGERSDFPRDIVERCLAHATGSRVEQAYRRGQEIDRRECRTHLAQRRPKSRPLPRPSLPAASLAGHGLQRSGGLQRTAVFLVTAAAAGDVPASIERALSMSQWICASSGRLRASSQCSRPRCSAMPPVGCTSSTRNGQP
jgi:integrase